MNKVLLGRTLINLDTGLVITWQQCELGYSAASVCNPLAVATDAGPHTYQLDREGSEALWRCLSYPSGREALGVLAIGTDE